MDVVHEGPITYTEGWTDGDVPTYKRQMSVSLLPLEGGDIYSLTYGSEKIRRQILDRAFTVNANHHDHCDVMVNHPNPEARADSIWAHIDAWIAAEIVKQLRGNQ